MMSRQSHFRPLHICALFAALCLLLTGCGAQPKTLLDRMQALHLPAEAYTSADSDSAEAPQLSENDLAAMLPSKTIVQGTILSLEYVRIPLSGSVWYLAAAVIRTDEVLAGENVPEQITVAGAAVYTGDGAETGSGGTPVPAFAGCRTGLSAVFVLRPVENTPWQIGLTAVDPASIGEMLLVRCLEPNDPALVRYFS